MVKTLQQNHMIEIRLFHAECIVWGCKSQHRCVIPSETYHWHSQARNVTFQPHYFLVNVQCYMCFHNLFYIASTLERQQTWYPTFVRSNIQYTYEGQIFSTTHEGQIYSIPRKVKYTVYLWRTNIQYTYEGQIYSTHMKVKYTVYLRRSNIQYTNEGQLYSRHMNRYSITYTRQRYSIFGQGQR